MMKENRGFKGVWIPREIYLSKELNWTDKILYIEIHSLSKTKEGCFASNKYLAEFVGKGETTISDSLTKMKKLGFIKETRFDGRRRSLEIGNSAESEMAQQSRQNRQGYNISNKVINKEDKVSKDTYTAKAVKGSFGNRCVRVWNEFPFTMNHKADTIIKQVDQYMTELMEGTFYKNKSIDTEYFKRSNVKMNGRKYTKTELLQGLNNLALFFKEGYPKIKTRELPNLIYNPRTGTSIFLSVIDSPPKPLKDERAITDPNPKLTRLFPFSTPSDKAKLIDGIKTLVKYQKNINVRTQQMEHLFGTPLLLCKTYKEWMEGEDWIEKIEVGYVKSTGKMFKKFVDDMEDECHGYKLVTKLNPTM